METKFAHAYIKGTDSMPRKTSVVASLVRDRYVSDAVVILEHTPRRAARAVLKAVESANANLLNKYPDMDTKTVRIARISVTAGTRIRRYVPASRGRALPFEKVSSNIFVEVAGEEKEKKAEKKSDKKAEISRSAKVGRLTSSDRADAEISDLQSKADKAKEKK